MCESGRAAWTRVKVRTKECFAVRREGTQTKVVAACIPLQRSSSAERTGAWAGGLGQGSRQVPPGDGLGTLTTTSEKEKERKEEGREEGSAKKQKGEQRGQGRMRGMGSGEHLGLKSAEVRSTGLGRKPG